MKSQSLYHLAASMLVACLFIACVQQETAHGPDNYAVGFVDADGTHPTTVRDTLHNPFPHLQMADGRISVNDRCPVRKVPLNKRLPTLFVNGRPLGFC